MYSYLRRTDAVNREQPLDTARPIRHEARPNTLLRLTAAISAGILLAVSGPPLELSFLAFAYPGLLWIALGNAPTVAWGGLMGLCTGFTVNLIVLFWAVPLLVTFGEFPVAAAVPTAVLLWLAQGLPFGIAGASTALLVRHGAPGWLVLPTSLTVALSITPALFPWRPAATQVAWTEWAQLAEVGGEPLLDFLLATASCAMVHGLRHRGRSRGPALAIAVAAVFLPVIYGSIRLPQIRRARAAAPTLRVGLVQPNVGMEEKRDPARRAARLTTLREMTRRLEARGAELVVWPETAYPYPFPRGLGSDTDGEFAIRGDGVRGPLLVGAITAGEGCNRWNSVLAIDPHGDVRGVTDKVVLLAFGEYVPLWSWLPPLREFFACPGLQAGSAPGVVTLAGRRIAVLNCYEDILPEISRRALRHGADLLVNVTNDAWFGDTAEPELHHFVARMRSIESRRDLVRAVNTGVSGHVFATGENAFRTATWQPAAKIAEVRLLDIETPWLRFGDLLTPALAGALLGLALALARDARNAQPARRDA